jgi:3D (Asp-Asp-Asp) domain-containing protein
LHQTSLSKFLLSGLVFIFLMMPAWGCAKKKQTLTLTATAYNSLPGQTQGDPNLTAWGDKLVPGMKAIAVSRDLLAMGLTRGVQVKIKGLQGTYIIMDKLHARWKLRIDIYMGTDINAARQWGRREVTISW